MFPTDFNFTNTVQSTASKTAVQNKVGRSPHFNYKTKRFEFVDGKNIENTQILAIEQWIELFIRTEVDKFAIYSSEFGVNLNKLIGYRLPRSFVVSEIKRRITEGILNKVPCIVSVDNWRFDKGTFYFTVTTNTGEEVRLNYDY